MKFFDAKQSIHGKFPSLAMIVFLLITRAVIGIIGVSVWVVFLYFTLSYGMGPWIIGTPILTAIVCIQWITQNGIDANEGLFWHLHICRIGDVE
jgi:hypothetical protein